MTTLQEKGTLSINTENIFPIIKKFLYSDHEIFLRELVSNAVDATQKLKKLASIGQYTEDLGDLKIEVSFDKKKKTVTVSDHGIGMTADEVKKYINQIAFSGATEFVEKFKDKANASDIIGKFGLGFYSAFMVAEKVELITRSYLAAETEAVRWSCDGSTEFELHPAVKKQRGTDVILHIAKDAEEFLDEHRLLGILEKYCRFLPVEIKFGTRQESVEDGTDAEGRKKYKTVTVDRIINNTRPLWTQSPTDLKDEDYLKFYKELYPFSEDPLFWIHLNVDFPFNLTGILYFPKVKDFELHRNKIQLYCRQVFITDEVKDIVPDFLMLLHGVIDSPDIPLNVSRSYLQSDSSVKKISQHITKKVADKLQELFKKERESFEKKWDDISLFVKYGMITDEKFYDRAKDFALLKNTEGKYSWMDEYHNRVKESQQDKDKNIVYLYTTDAARQDSFIQSTRNKGYDVLIMDGMLDAHFINTLEYKLDKVRWKRVDSDTPEKLIAKADHPQMVLSADEQNQIKSIFEKAADKAGGMQVTVEALAPNELPAVITRNEFARRMKDMARVGGGAFPLGPMPDSLTVAVNGNHALIQRILKAENEDEKTRLARQAIDLALLSQHMLTGTDLTAFIKRSVDFIS